MGVIWIQLDSNDLRALFLNPVLLISVLGCLSGDDGALRGDCSIDTSDPFCLCVLVLGLAPSLSPVGLIVYGLCGSFADILVVKL